TRLDDRRKWCQLEPVAELVPVADCSGRHVDKACPREQESDALLREQLQVFHVEDRRAPPEHLRGACSAIVAYDGERSPRPEQLVSRLARLQGLTEMLDRLEAGHEAVAARLEAFRRERSVPDQRP